MPAEWQGFCNGWPGGLAVWVSRNGDNGKHLFLYDPEAYVLVIAEAVENPFIKDFFLLP